MTSLIEPIRRGEAAIIRARAQGRDVRDWEAHLEKLKHEAREYTVDDPVLSLREWYPILHRLHMNVVAETKDFDYGWIKKHRPELYRRVKELENQIDAMEHAQLSAVISVFAGVADTYSECLF